MSEQQPDYSRQIAILCGEIESLMRQVGKLQADREALGIILAEISRVSPASVAKTVGRYLELCEQLESEALIRLSERGYKPLASRLASQPQDPGKSSPGPQSPPESPE